MMQTTNYPVTQPLSIRTRLATIFLWILTGLLGALCIVFGHDVLVGIVMTLTGTNNLDNPVQARGAFQVIYSCTFIMAWIAWVAMVIYGGETHLRHMGSEQSKRLLRHTLIAEVIVLVTVLVFYELMF